MMRIRGYPIPPLNAVLKRLSGPFGGSHEEFENARKYAKPLELDDE